MPGDPKRAVVKVVLKSDNPLAFDIESNDLPQDNEGNLIFCNDGHPGFQVEFELDDRMELGYLFPPNKDKEDAVWSRLGTECPRTACQEVFTVRSVRPDRKTLIVLNPNLKPALGRFTYTLRVTKTGGAPYLDLDPGGLNQNGNTLKLSTSLIFVSGGVVGSLLTLGTQALLRTT